MPVIVERSDHAPAIDVSPGGDLAARQHAAPRRGPVDRGAAASTQLPRRHRPGPGCLDRLGAHTGRRLGRGCLAAAAIAVAAPAGAGTGEAIFTGKQALPARIVGQDFVLPVRASRCINCHATTAASAGAASTTGTQAFGPALTATWLMDAQRRRGGPPSRYDAASLCALLRTGVDPAYVVIPRAMPRYEIEAVDCRALWTFLTDQR